MDDRNAKEVIFLPIKPKFASKILDGTKLVEFRKSNFPNSVKKIVLYSSSPEQKVVAWLEVDEIVETTKFTAWKKYGNVGQISKTDYNNYYKNTQTAKVIVIKVVNPLCFNSKDLHKAKILSIPQSFCYLNKTQFDYITRFNK